MLVLRRAWRWATSWGQRTRVKHYLDILRWNLVSGWIFAPGRQYVIRVWRGEDCVATVRPHLKRPDVARHFPGVEEALVSGFRTSLSPIGEGEACVLRVTASDIDAEGGMGAEVEIGRGPVVGPAAIREAFAPREGDAPRYSAFPKGVESAVLRLFPQIPAAGGDAAAQMQVAAGVKELCARAVGVGAPEVLTGYLRFLSALNAHFRFVTQYFLATNESRDADAKDHCATPNSAREMLSIAHHLYVLKSYGVVGDFAEFGCFKGFSSSMLSYACSLLGMKMHIFDSFAGLPPSSSKYYKAGDFCGSLDEVRRNVAQFGVIDAVQFHEGYFAESAPRARDQIARLATLWMDVDLYDSAQDVMTMFDKLDISGAVFTHECDASAFDGDRIRPRAPSPEEPLPAILEAYARAGAEPAGRHIHGYTSAFWSRRDGVPVLNSAALMDIVAAI